MAELESSEMFESLNIAIKEKAQEDRTRPEALVAALLSEASYVGKTKAFGWNGIANELSVHPDEAERMRQALASGEHLSPEQAERLRESFWRDDLMMLTAKEIEAQADLPDDREELARRLWVALYTQPARLPQADDHLWMAVKKNEASGNKIRNPALGPMGEVSPDVGFTRPGVFRATDVHCMLFAKVWTPQEGFGDGNKTLWIAARGTENGARALQNPVKTFLMDYAFKAYRNFAKAYKSRYKDAVDAALTATDTLPEHMRPAKVILCGHSLGGSEAIEALIQGKGAFQKRSLATEGYTFGSPGTGAVGALSAAGAVPIAATLGLFHAAAVLMDRIPGLRPAAGLMAQKASGLQDFSRLARVAGAKMLHALGRLPVINLINRASQVAANVVDATSEWNYRAPTESLNKGMFGLGWVGFREPGAEAWAEKSGGMTHYAHRRDFVRLVGECAGFDLPGKTQLIDARQAAGGPVKEHSCSMYVNSMQDLLTRENEASHPWMQSLVGCRDAVNQMMQKHAQLHKRAIEAGVEEQFIQQQLKSSTTYDENEASSWIRRRLAREHLKIRTDPMPTRADAAEWGGFSQFAGDGESKPRLTIKAGAFLSVGISAIPDEIGASSARVLYKARDSMVGQSKINFNRALHQRFIIEAKRCYASAVMERESEAEAKRLAVGKSRLTLVVDNTKTGVAAAQAEGILEVVAPRRLPAANEAKVWAAGFSKTMKTPSVKDPSVAVATATLKAPFLAEMSASIDYAPGAAVELNASGFAQRLREARELARVKASLLGADSDPGRGPSAGLG